VFNLDGRTPDDGSVVETAAAFAAGKPIVIYKTSPITMLSGADNPMVEGLTGTWSYAEDVPSIAPALKTAIAGAKPYTYAPPPNVAAQIAEGEKVWNVLSTMRAMPSDPVDLIKWVEELYKELTGGGESQRFQRDPKAAQTTS
jgi:hypothetical protein